MIHHSNLSHTFFPNISEQCRLEILADLNSNITKAEKSHFINRRWENLYLHPNDVKGVKSIFQIASKLAKNIYGKSLIVPHQGYGISFDEFWFNVAKPGEETGWHNHKKNAVVSGVYYLDIPIDSGDIQFRKKEKDEWVYWTEQSKTGKMILFDSKLEHSVSKNKSGRNRISIAFNLYALPLKIEIDSNQYSLNKFFS
ncbi:MAG: hypothetical protein HOB40_01595 [Candidatus Marinimicrobia bacterium]|jgi:hypothetical protein|nr:hypothetical protein [Candidatus Neomarinimicrobiota bacterium]MBT3501036.1 hypothetical protein [Candidatus Neomarinimicrobiota bacterium]MBT3838820.1 hypothetical protein [Candidatus Neomarinimicrobiota bacterium]MBT3998797.1 hypothetical protein [Candidatus Neomarinimicrobiota bacterium]MBT4282643.1 hypothetical protein [Candidatus Neomarinimicrobiota bacterium]